ncbi:lipoxygenase family protein [Okeania hirsuta]|uniref:lipoxygenase family protein n=1 Tax=Okeania hirsuta TaxID=1458930 RepID=UPI000F537B4E|nr:lipoxygenase family protein [Okeania hirsuta]RQH21865.1 lipoxygenase [Okeania hirsuta]
MTNCPTDTTSSSVNHNLEVAKQEYQYNYNHIPPVAMVNELPEREKPSKEWFLLLVKSIRLLFVNIVITNRGNQGNKGVRDDVIKYILEVIYKQIKSIKIGEDNKIIPFFFQLLLNQQLLLTQQLLSQGIPDDFHEIDDLFVSILRENGLSVLKDILEEAVKVLKEGSPEGHATSLEDYQKLFSYKELFPETGGIPSIAYTFEEDEVFAYMRVAGYNPLMIEQVSSLDERFPVTETQYQEVMGNDDSLAAAGKEGRLYLADYKILAGALNGTYPNKYQKYIYAPLALFAVPKGSDPNRKLRPVAIQCGQTPGADNPIFTPNSSKYAWLFAKTVVEIVDANFHEAVSHLGRTHLFVGSFIPPTHRQLPQNHCLSLLLRPHFEGTLAINDGAQGILIAPKGGVDSLLSSTIDNARVLAVLGLQSYGFNGAMLPEQLKQRGVDDSNLLPVYPYRDDALLLWDAIHQWVSDYLSLYYSRDEEVQAYRRLQAWAGEVMAFDGARVPDFGEDGGIRTLEYLINAVTLIIFTASAQHAAVNFPQKDIMSYAPAVPLAGYLPSSILKGEVSEQDYLDLLPPLEQAQGQLNLTYLLGSVYYTKLGEYSKNHFTDSKVKPLLEKFQENLNQVEATIEQRNFNRPQYRYLLPSQIPQSINI